MKKKFLGGAVLALALGLTLAGCGSKTNDSASSTAESKKAQTTKSTEAKKRTFTDDAGRKVEIPAKLTKIAPSGPLAQIVLYTSSPDALVGISSDLPENAKGWIPDKYYNLPKFGQFYGKNANLNMEALTAAAPEAVIDIGEKKKTEKEDMDSLQKQLDIPVLFIEATLEHMDETYQKLGDLTGRKKENDKLASYCKEVLSTAKKNKEKIGDKQKTVYYAGGQDGLSTNAEGSFHAEVFDVLGAKNVVSGMEVASKGEGTTISMEQLMQWQPDYILAATDAIYQQIKTDATWQTLTAVKEGHVYRVPDIPFNFLASPPSVNRIMGLQWLGKVMYPDEYQDDLNKEIKEFYKDFYHVDLTQDQLTELLKNSVPESK